MKKSLFYLYFLGIPALARGAGSGDDIQSLLGKIAAKVIFPFVNFLLVLATLVFLWGVIQYVIAGDSADKAKKARQQMVWGIIGLAVMASANVIVKIVQDTLFGL